MRLAEVGDRGGGVAGAMQVLGQVEVRGGAGGVRRARVERRTTSSGLSAQALACPFATQSRSAAT